MGSVGIIQNNSRDTLSRAPNPWPFFRSQDDICEHQRWSGEPPTANRRPLLQRLVPHRHGRCYSLWSAHLPKRRGGRHSRTNRTGSVFGFRDNGKEVGRRRGNEMEVKMWRKTSKCCYCFNTGVSMTWRATFGPRALSLTRVLKHLSATLGFLWFVMHTHEGLFVDLSMVVFIHEHKTTS